MPDRRPKRQQILEIPQRLHRSHPRLRRTRQVEESALAILRQLADVLKRPNLSQVAICDVGCGVKLAEAIINHSIDIKHYAGIDVDSEVVAFLQQHIERDGFEFHRLNAYNERYNPTGETLSEASRLPQLRLESPTVITGYSLFTHVDPSDFLHLASMMREVAAPETKLVFTAYLDEHSDAGHGFIDGFSKRFGSSAAGIAKGGYVDVFPDDPLRVTVYDRRYANELLRDAGWHLDEVREPTPATQHLLVASVRPKR